MSFFAEEPKKLTAVNLAISTAFMITSATFLDPKMDSGYC